MPIKISAKDVFQFGKYEILKSSLPLNPACGLLVISGAPGLPPSGSTKQV